MQLTIDDQGLGEYLARIENEEPTSLTIQGRGQQSNRAIWLSLILTTEQEYRRTDITVERVTVDGSDLSEVKIRLEDESHTTQPHA